VLESDSASGQTRSSASTRWSAAPATPSTSRHLELPLPLEPAPAPVTEPLRLRVEASAPKAEPEEPESPAPAYSRDPTEFDPALLATLDPQLRFHPFEAFEDLCRACLDDVLLPVPRTQRSRPRSSSLSQSHLSTSRASATMHSSSLSDTTIPAPHDPEQHLQLPAYPGSKPLPDIPPPSPLPSVEQTQPQLDLSPRPSVVMAFETFTPLRDTSFPAETPTDTVHFFPVHAPSRAGSKSVGVGGKRTMRRLTSAIARLRGRD
jgi:hypothetical protein